MRPKLMFCFLSKLISEHAAYEARELQLQSCVAKTITFALKIFYDALHLHLHMRTLQQHILFCSLTNNESFSDKINFAA